MTGRYRSRNEIVGALAMWAVRQSPYPVPEKLSEALLSFYEKMPADDIVGVLTEWPSLDALYASIWDAIERVPEIVAWNSRRNGRDGMGFVSRYDKPSPDDDFIDLHALCNNVARSVWEDEA